MQTHAVLNQASELGSYNLYSSDPVLFDLIQRNEASWANQLLSDFGAYAGSQEAILWSRQAEENPPVLHNFDRFGNRIDRVDFHPAYHALMDRSIKHGVHSLPWTSPRSGAHVARAALMFMDFQNDPAHCCPISMTYSVIPSLAKQAELSREFKDLILSRTYDSRFIPAANKEGMTIGMSMTEKQGGSDLRANTTTAALCGNTINGKPEYRLTGHKWFCSAPMSDAFLMLAQTQKGLSCFFVPRLAPDGKTNGIFVQRLKDKLGNKANASSEIELENASAFLVGEEGRGVAAIIDMVNHTRLDCIIGAAALMRQSLLQAWQHCRFRSAFGKLLIDQPLMINVLADLSLESEAASRLMIRVASAYDQEKESEQEKCFKRIGSAIAKYWICKRAPAAVAEALECMGGNGYVESGPMPRLFRESPLLSIWEGSGNVICLDVLRAAAREPDTLEAFIAELELSKGISKHFDLCLEKSKESVRRLSSAFEKREVGLINDSELTARSFVENLALSLQAAILYRQTPEWLADSFFSARLQGGAGRMFGTLSLEKKRMQELIERQFAF